MATANEVSTDARPFVLPSAPTPPAGRLSNGYPVSPRPPSTQQVSGDCGPSDGINLEDQVDVARCVDRYAEEYNMDHPNRGRAVILNHFEYNDRKFSDRDGTDKDRDELIKTLPKIGFREEDILVYEDLTKKEIMTKMMKLAKEDHSKNDCLMVFVLTHGSSDGLLLAKDGHYNAKRLWEHFEADKCPSLAGKPKIFIQQACRGNEYGKIVNVRGPVDSQVHVDGGRREDEEQIEYKIPVVSDFLMAYSTEEGKVCFRHPTKGSWFIQTFCKKLSMPSMTQEYDLVRILTRINRHVAVGNSEYETVANVTPCRQTDIGNSVVGGETDVMLEGTNNKMAEDDAGRRWYRCLLELCCLGKKEKAPVHRLTRQAPAFNSRLTREVYFHPKPVAVTAFNPPSASTGCCLPLPRNRGTTF